MPEVGNSGPDRSGNLSGPSGGGADGNNGNPADRNNPGVSTGIDSSSGAIGGFGPSLGNPDRGIARGVGTGPVGSPTGGHPDQAAINAAIAELNAIDDTDYGAYDARSRSFQSNYGSINAYGYGPTMSSQQLGQNQTIGAIGLSTQQLGQNQTVGAMGLSTQQLGQTETVGYQQSPHALDAIEEANATAKSIAMSSQQLGQTQTVGYQSPSYDQSAVDAQVMDDDTVSLVDAAIKANPHKSKATPVGTNFAGLSLDISFKGNPQQDLNVMETMEARTKNFIDAVKNIKSRTIQENLVKEFLDVNKKNLDQLAQLYGQTVDDELGIFKYAPMLGMLNMARKGTMALLSKMGFNPGIESPAMRELMGLATQLGVISKDGGREATDQEMEYMCNNTSGYRWDSVSKSCTPIQQDSQTGLLNPYNGMLG